MNKSNLIKEQELISASKQGDQKAFSELMSSYRDSLLVFILKYARSEEDAEDIIQESLQKVFRNIKLYNSQYSFSTWVYNIAKNTSMDYMRKNTRNPILQLNENTEQAILEEKNSPESELINKQNLKRIERIINDLKTPYREVAELRFINDLSYEEISVMLNIPINTVKTQLKRAREVLKNKLIEDQYVS